MNWLNIPFDAAILLLWCKQNKMSKNELALFLCLNSKKAVGSSRTSPVNLIFLTRENLRVYCIIISDGTPPHPIPPAANRKSGSICYSRFSRVIARCVKLVSNINTDKSLVENSEWMDMGKQYQFGKNTLFNHSWEAVWRILNLL